MIRKIRLTRTMVREYYVDDVEDLKHYPGCSTIEEMAQVDADADDRELTFEDCNIDEVKWEVIE